jgi:hypothetical protein
MEGERLQKGWGKLPDGAIARAKEVNGIIMAWSNQPLRLFDRGL